ncbi:hypothetical protein JOL62DRAFT_554582 [Phyllosticta paracitricarpa]|uniref:Haloacid dehalogenase-like hydrolase n=1 Tax=Phyllosticta paracitricarpa TaxID=2016321 RepID=A0ABR1NDF7_9PEZI
MAFAPLPIHLILDWDGTLTAKDTLHFLGQISAEHAVKDAAPPSSSWDDIVKAYVDDLDAHVKAYRPSSSERTTIAEEKAWLTSLEDVDLRSVRRVEDAGLFTGITADTVSQGAAKAVGSGQLQLRKGWENLLFRNEGNEGILRGKISILSVNWSATFIREALLHAAYETKALQSTLMNADVLRRTMQNIDISANEFEGLDGFEGSSGRLTKSGGKGIRTSQDKLERMPIPHKFGGDELVIYVGDSCTDLEALLAADVGVCVRDEPMGSGQRELAETLERIGVLVHRLKLLAEMPPPDDSRIDLWWTPSLEELSLSLDSLN